MKAVLLMVGLALLPVEAMGQAAPKQDAWAGWTFLLGKWSAGQSSGVPGSASAGGFTLEPELGGQVLVRKNHAEYPATKDHPAIVHDDLTVIYHEAGATKALYNDSEGHVIHYAVSLGGGGGKQIVFLSEDGGGPQYRLSYADLGGGKADLRFEVAPPDKPGQFGTYVEATVKKE